MPRSVFIVDRFSSHATALRKEFDARFAEPRAARRDRFVWDYWNVPGQYTALRTPAWTYFSQALYRKWHASVVNWGRRVLGCHDISPPWMSNYVEGCGQELHGDLPHGPWAFVFSLTPWQSRVFTGGETMLLRDEVLDYWHSFVSERAIELPDVMRFIAPKFNRLTVFDPRIPHGVRRVHGTVEPRQGRLVLHGWFVQPRPFIEGGLAAGKGSSAVSGAIDDLSPAIGKALGSLPLAGLLSLQIVVAPDGSVQRTRVLSDTTRVAGPFEAERRAAIRAVQRRIGSWRLPRRSTQTVITLPLVFAR